MNPRSHNASGKILGAFLFFFGALAVAALLLQGNETVGYGSPQYVLADGAFQNVDVTAAAWAVFDAETGEVLGAMHMDERYPIASITKLITADAARAQFDLTDTAVVSWRAVSTEGRAGKLAYGEELTLRELLVPLLLESSNDAAEVVAEHLDRAHFISGMNAHAAALDMNDTALVDPSGLSPDNISTTADLKRLLSHLYENSRYLLDISSLSRYVGADHIWQNVNPVSVMPAFLGGKHGYTEAANRTLAAVFAESLGDETRPIGIVLLASDDLVTDVAALRAALMRAVTYQNR